MKVETLFILSLPNQEAAVDQWEKIIELSPINFCKKGEKVSDSPTARISPNTYWIFGIRRHPEKSVEEQILKVINQVNSKKNKIQKLVNKLGLEVNCEVYVWIDEIRNLSITLNNDLLKKMSELNINFTFSRY